MGIYIDNKSKAQKLADLAIYVAQTLLECSAEIYRVEDTAFRICNNCKGINQVDVFVTTNTIIVSFYYYNDNIIAMRRVKNISVNLLGIEKINEFSRRFVSETIPLEKAFEEVTNIRELTKIKAYKKIIAGGLGAAILTLVIGGTILEGVVSFFISIITLSFLNKINEFNYSFFIESYFASFILSFIASLVVIVGIVKDPNNMIIGSIMPLVPGVSITNSVRDLMSGDVLAGVSGITIAIFTAAAIAIGVGSALLLFKSGGHLWI